MIAVQSIREDEGQWTVVLKVEEGVYRLPAYPVRVENVPRPPEGWTPEAVSERIGRYVQERVTIHMREGSLPPRGTRLDARQLTWDE